MGWYIPRQESLWSKDGTLKQFVVYILSNNSMTLYTGVTNNLQRRSSEHRSGAVSFTSRYHFDRVVYYEQYELVTQAIAREKQIKGMSRRKKIALIKRVNPEWRNLLA